MCQPFGAAFNSPHMGFHVSAFLSAQTQKVLCVTADISQWSKMLAIACLDIIHIQEYISGIQKPEGMIHKSKKYRCRVNSCSINVRIPRTPFIRHGSDSDTSIKSTVRRYFKIVMAISGEDTRLSAELLYRSCLARTRRLDPSWSKTCSPESLLQMISVASKSHQTVFQQRDTPFFSLSFSFHRLSVCIWRWGNSSERNNLHSSCCLLLFEKLQ